MILAEVMTRDPVTVPAATPVHEAERVARDSNVRHLLVTKGEDLVGVLCRCDLSRAPAESTVDEWMARPATAEWADDVDDAAWRMRLHGWGCMPVMSGGRLVGIVTYRDLRRAGIEADARPEVCAACGSREEVLAHRGDVVGFCAECLRKLDDDMDLGGSG